jgi:adenylosuccinate synthase
MINGIDKLCMTKLDVLDDMETILVNDGLYVDGDGKTYDYIPSRVNDLRVSEYLEFPGWKSSTKECRKFQDLPENARAFIEAIEERIDPPIHWIGVGPGRDEMCMNHVDQ